MGVKYTIPPAAIGVFKTAYLDTLWCIENCEKELIDIEAERLLGVPTNYAPGHKKFVQDSLQGWKELSKYIQIAIPEEQ